MRVAINGFGRIGRTILKICLAKGVNVVAINDLHGAEDAAYLLRYDSIYGRYDKKIDFYDKWLMVDGHKIEVLSEQNPFGLPWQRLKIDCVIESTGKFTDRESAIKHLVSGAKKVIITAPAKNPDITIVPGVNDNLLRKEHKIISVASCTTNCLAPVAYVLEKEYGIKEALMTSVHAYTNDQVVQDGFHKKKRRGRAAGTNMIPTSTGAAESVAEVIPSLRGKMTGLSVRVPVACGSLVDFVAVLEKDFSVEDVNAKLEKASKKELKGILKYSEDEIVSSDVIGDSHSAVVDGLSTQKVKNMVKVLAWYDNEFGYSNRVVDVIKMLR